MRLPNRYGSVVKLSGKRRKPYAVRITAGHTEYIIVPNKIDYYPIIDKYNMKFRKKSHDYIADVSDGLLSDLRKANLVFKPGARQKFKYLEYFEKAVDAYAYLARMNNGEVMQPHISIASQPTFKDVYNRYIAFIDSMNKKPTQTRLASYTQGFNLWYDLHAIRFSGITTQQLQNCLSAHSYLSKSSVTRMITIIRQMYKYALAHDICKEDRSTYLFAEYSKTDKSIHSPFSKDEISVLWEHKNDDIARIALILIATGMRASEFLTLKTENIYLKEMYMIGGMKTEAGKDRIIPLHKKIVPLVQLMYNKENPFLFTNSAGNPYSISHFNDQRWKPYMEKIGLKHLTHDCRHTCATLMEEAGISEHHKKLILGHKIHDITNGVYTHVSPEALVNDINKINL